MELKVPQTFIDPSLHLGWLTFPARILYLKINHAVESSVSIGPGKDLR